MASPNTLSLMKERRANYAKGVGNLKIIPSVPPNRAERRRRRRGWRLRSKMGKERWSWVWNKKHLKVSELAKKLGLKKRRSA